MDEPADYDYELPPELLAKEPPANREDARLMVVRRDNQSIRHHRIVDLPGLLSSGDCLVLNDTRVLPARLFGTRTSTGGGWEGLFLSEAPDKTWQLIGETRGKLTVGETITLRPAHADRGETLVLKLLDRDDSGIWTVRPEATGSTAELLDRFGTLPLPPYLGRRLATENDRDRYQTTFARNPGAVAAPTAGLHLTPELLSACDRSEIGRAFVTLHVGIGTFRPVSVNRLNDHTMHSEWCEITDSVAKQLRTVRSAGGRIVAVGTTSVRTLETAAASGRLNGFRGRTDIFIRPPYTFRAVDALLTNFHLPRSTLLVLLASFVGLDLMHAAYRCAIEERYRFYSYGDAMLIL